ncbi:MAG TPA: DUF885 family protein [Chthoniobacterales bacterium]|nr:DUF885 family protein [Chthoniobacterales bacterium]
MRSQTFWAQVFAALVLFARLSSAGTIGNVGDYYLDRYFEMFPTRATQAGRHDLDSKLEDFSESRIADWVEFNRTVGEKVIAWTAHETGQDDSFDAEALLGQIDRELNALTVLRRAERDPLYWSSVAADATVFLLVRDDRPLGERQEHAKARARNLPRFVRQGRDHFAHVDPKNVAPEFCQIAAGQLRATSKFYKEGFAEAVGGDEKVRRESTEAATALADFAATLDELAKRAKSSVRLGGAYPETFRVGTRITDSIRDVLSRAQSDLAATRSEAATYGRTVWTDLIKNETPPKDDIELLRTLFDRVAADHGESVDDALAQWRTNVAALDKFVHEQKIMTLPDPLTLIVDRSPSFFVGQSVGGVYPPGPYAPNAKTILFLPTPSPDATAEQRESFFRDFNEHFNKMIVPHELIPGHYVQFKIAAHQPHKIRTVFPDPLYVEGWGTFCERILLDQGWGGPLERLAHLKKQLENIARTIVDIRVHTENMSRAEVVRFVKEEALQNDQFASNMWTRAITSSPQITTYYLGYRKVREAYNAAHGAAGDRFELREFMDGMMELGPVRLDHYIERFSAKSSDRPNQTQSRAK